MDSGYSNAPKIFGEVSNDPKTFDHESLSSSTLELTPLSLTSDQNPSLPTSSVPLENHRVRKPKWSHRLKNWLLVQMQSLFLTVEKQGIAPTVEEERNDNRFYQLFFLVFSADFNVLAFSLGTLGPLVFNLGLLDSNLVILVANLMFAPLSGALAIFGPKLGLRSMVQARYSFGYYGSKFPCIFNILTQLGYLILNTIVGAKLLSIIFPKLNESWCIVLISVFTLIITVFGAKMVNKYETLLWIPNLIGFSCLLGFGYKELKSVKKPTYPEPSFSAVMTFFSIIAAWFTSWVTLADFGVYHSSKASSWRTFLHMTLGLIIGSAPWQMIGAVFSAFIYAVPAWNKEYTNNGFQGLIAAILSPMNIYGKLLIILMAISLISASGPSMYSFGISSIALSDHFTRWPQFLFPVLSTIIMIPCSIFGAQHFFDTLNDIIALAGYWAASYTAINLVDFFIIRKANIASYNNEDFDKPNNLPSCIPSLVAFFSSLGCMIPFIKLTWYSGPIALAGTGDIGIIFGFISAAFIYWACYKVNNCLYTCVIA